MNHPYTLLNQLDELISIFESPVFPTARVKMGNPFNKEDNDKKQDEKATNPIVKVDSNYFPKDGYPVTLNRIEPIARVLLIGVYDDDNPLSIFRGMRYIIKEIWQLTIQFNRQYYSACIEIKDNPLLDIHPEDYRSRQSQHGESTAFMKIQQPQLCHSGWYNNEEPAVDYPSLGFPKPLKKEINMNMMPLMMDFESLPEQIPNNLRGYLPLIHACLKADPSQKGKICFLTIHESFVKKGRTQRRPGLHIELPGQGIGGKAEWFHGWGGGYWKKDGLFIASNVSDSCAVWNCRIVERDDKKEKIKAMDAMGGLEHIRALMPKEQKYLLKEEKLYWITDRTPHEALPMKKSGWRQFFRLVSSKLGAWYVDHSTANPQGIVPNPDITQIIKGNKFKMKGSIVT
eukprot:91754_1